MDVATHPQFALDIGIGGQALPAGTGEFVLKFLESMAARGEQVASAFCAQESQRILVDHAAIHDPNALAFAEAAFDGIDDVLDSFEVAGVASEGLMGQR